MSTSAKNEMSVGILKYCILLISLLTVAPVCSKKVQCKGLDNSTVKSLVIPDKYSVNVEVKLMDAKTVLLIREDRTENITSLKVTNISHVVHCLYHYPQKKLVTVIEDLRGRKEQECQVTSLAPQTPCIPNSPWTIPLHELRRINNFTWFPEMKEYPRGIDSLHLELCEYDVNDNIRMKLDTFTAINWKLPRSKTLINLIRLEFTLPNSHVISDYIDFFTNAKDPNDFLLPHGTFCPGLNISSLKPPRIDVPFSVNTEIIHLDEIKNERLIFDHKKKLALLETESRKVSSGAQRVIYDYNTGYKYTISLRTGHCKTPEKIRLGDFFVKGSLGSKSYEMSDPENYFNIDKAEIQYIGKREVRGVMCDVWVGKYQDVSSEMINTIEWYYTPKSWTERIGTKQEDKVIFRMDIWEPGTQTPSIHNFFDFDTNPITWSQFDISACYSKPDEKIRFTIRLQANGRKDLLPYTTGYSAVQHLQEELSSLTRISPILFSQTMVDYDMNSSVIYLTSTLLSGPKDSNPKFATRNIKEMKDVFESMSRKIRSNKWKVLLPIQIVSKSENLQLTADKIWKSVTEGEINGSDSSTTPSLSTTQKTSPTQHATTKKTRPPTSTAASSTADVPSTLNSSDSPSTETAGQTKITTSTSTETTTANPTISSSTSLNSVTRVIRTSTLSTNYLTTLLTKRTGTIHRISSTDLPPEVIHSLPPLRIITESSTQTTAAKTSLKSSSLSRVSRCTCPTVSTNISCGAANLDKEKKYTKLALIGFVCGSFVVGMLFAIVIVSIKSVFCRRKHNTDPNSELHFLTEMQYN